MPDVFVVDGETAGSAFAYVVGDFGLQVVDVSDPEAPRFHGEPIDTGRSEGVFISEGYAYVASETGLHVVDLDCQP